MHGALVVDGHLAVGLHVVEHRHPARPDHRHLAHLVGVEPRQVQVADLARLELDVGEHDVLDSRAEKGGASRRDLGRRAVDQMQHHRDVVHAQRPQHVLLLADLTPRLTRLPYT